MDALSEAILRLLKRQDQSEQRLGRIEAALGLGGVTAPVAPPVAIESPPEPSPPLVAPAPQPAPSVARQPGGSDRPREFETQVGLTWISRIGAVTLIFCVAFIFKYAIDN